MAKNQFTVNFSTPLEHFMSRIFIQPNGCWNWNGTLENGYGRFAINGKQVRMPRAAWLMLRGPIPEGLEPDHLCRNRACVNCDHMELVTHKENVRRGNAGKQFTSRTHCPVGHAYDSENTQIKPTGARRCRACARIQCEAKRRAMGIFPRKTHCPRGHEFTPENTRIRVHKDRTQRVCITCRRMNARKKPS